MTTTAVSPMLLDGPALGRAQRETLATPPLRYDLFSRVLFRTVDLLYGRQRTLTKFYVLELLARVPYQAWERACYRAMTKLHRHTGLAHRIYERIIETRAQQDNEQWHLLVLAELLHTDSKPLGLIRYRLLPWLMSGLWHILSWLLFLVRPEWSYSLNAHFEDHAEHEYMLYVSENPTLSAVPWRSQLNNGENHASIADVLRQIGHDERMHKTASLNSRRHRHEGVLRSHQDKRAAA